MITQIFMWLGVLMLLALPVVWLIQRRQVMPKSKPFDTSKKYPCIVLYPPEKGGLKLEHLEFKEPPGNPYKCNGRVVYLLLHNDNTKNGKIYQSYEPLAEPPIGMPPEKLFRAKRCDPAVRLLGWRTQLMEKVALGSMALIAVVGMVLVFFIMSEMGKGRI